MSSVRRAVSCGFIPAVGSSRRSSLGSEARARAISSLRWSPYDRFLANTSRPWMPAKSSNSAARQRASRSSRRVRGEAKMAPTMLPFSRVCIPASTLSSALMVPKSRIFWNVRPIPILALRWAP